MPRIDAATLLHGAESAFTETEQTAETIERALKAAPHDLDVLLAAYRFSFYMHDYAEACTHAQAVLSHAARQLNIAQDWRRVVPSDAEFGAHRFAPGLYMQALIGWGYCLARLGEFDASEEVLSKAALLDPSDRFGGAWLLDKILNPPDDDDG